MSRPRRKRDVAAEAVAEVGSLPASVAVSPDTPVSVLAVVKARIDGVLRQEGEWFPLPAGRVAEFEASGWVASEARIAALWRSAHGRILSPDLVPSHYKAQPVADDALRVLHLTAYDPGSSVYRYHSAGNTVDGLASVLVRAGHSNPHCDLRTYDCAEDAKTVRLLLMTADCVVCHMDYRVLTDTINRGTYPRNRLFRLYHGSVAQDQPKRFVESEKDASYKATQGGARLYHLRPEFGVKHWLPIPMPVDDYAALAKGHERWTPKSGRKFRIAHSPTVRAIKGTDAFLAAVDYLRDHEGLPVEAVLIEGKEHGEALRLKATCDATFDSFWLGIQGAGLEAGAMGQAVLAGDPKVMADYTTAQIPLPYTYVHDGQALRDVIRRLIVEPTFYAEEAAKAHAYVRAYHDYHKVGERLKAWLTSENPYGVA